jgi:glycine betaine/choline ABC-type transport system substrate-binding protein
LKKWLGKLDGTIDVFLMLQMNYEVEIGQKSPDEVAFNFLK